MRTAITVPNRFRLPAYARRPKFRRAIGLAVGLALFWWLFGLWFGQFSGVPAWADQRNTFTQAIHHLADPYAALVWPYVPWTVLPLIPFGVPPAQWGVLAQMVLYFMLLAAVIYRFGGGFWAVVLLLTSSVALDTALEINLEWVACIGLLVPRQWSGPFLLVKPQAVSGYWFGFEPREILRAGLVVLLVLVVSFLLWPGWLDGMAVDIEENTLGAWGTWINIAPSHLLAGFLPRSVALGTSYGIGAALAIWSFRRKDVILGAVAWQMFVPYATLYGLMPVLALVAARWPKALLIFSVTTWLVYAGVIASYVMGR
jgi:hypothetical protein